MLTGEQIAELREINRELLLDQVQRRNAEFEREIIELMIGAKLAPMQIRIAELEPRVRALRSKQPH
jgi:hypothetical protein